MLNKKLLLGSLIFIGVILAIIYIFPFIIILVNSLKTKMEIVVTPLGLPEKWQFGNYVEAFKTMKFGKAFLNSLVITVFSVTIIVVGSSMTAYLFARYKWRINKFLFFLLIATMIIPFQTLMIPLVSIYGNLGLMNNRATLIYMYLGFGASLGVFLYHGFIKNIPKELEEAAMIEGYSTFKIFWKIIFPLLRPITATLVILDVLWIWNDFLLPSLILRHPDLRTIPLSTFYFYGSYSANWNLAMAGLVLSIIPVIIFYIFMQKYIIKGVMDGSGK